MTPLGWLALYRHRVRGFNARYLVVLQHGLIASRTRIAAPVIPAGSERATILTPSAMIDGIAHRVMLLDLTSIALALFAEPCPGATVDEDAISAGLDAIFRGYPVGLRTQA